MTEWRRNLLARLRYLASRKQKGLAPGCQFCGRRLLGGPLCVQCTALLDRLALQFPEPAPVTMPLPTFTDAVAVEGPKVTVATSKPFDANAERRGRREYLPYKDSDDD
jgi:hypothetical protein